MATGWVTFIGTVVATVVAYNLSTYFAEKVFLSMIPDEVENYIQYLPRMAKKLMKKAMILQSIVEMIVMFAGNLFFLWLLNAVVLQIVIYVECRKFNMNTLDIAAKNALGGAIAASVALLVWNILQLIPILAILGMIEGFPVIGWLIVPIILLIFNLIFGAGVGKAVALHQACAGSSEEPRENQESFHSYPALDSAYQLCNQTHPDKNKQCGINNIIGCLRTERVTEYFNSQDKDRCSSVSNILSTPKWVCQNKPFGVCNNKDIIIPLRSNYGSTSRF